MRQAPALVDLCVQLAIDNMRYLGNVGETDHHLLDRILSHCTLDQLKHIENSTVVRLQNTFKFLFQITNFLLFFCGNQIISGDISG